MLIGWGSNDFGKLANSKNAKIMDKEVLKGSS